MIKNKIKKLEKTGFFSIFLSSVFSKVIALLGGIVIVRILSKEDYGIYSYAINALTLLYILNDFGASNAALQYLTEESGNKKKQGSILKYALKLGLLGSTISGVLILLSPFFYPYKIVGARYITPMLFLIPIIMNLNNFILVILRANLENKKYAVLELLKTLACYLFLIVLSLMYGLKGAILSHYCYLIFGLILGTLFIIKNIYSFKKSDQLIKNEKKQFFKFSITTQINAILGSLLLNIDIFLVGVCVGTSTSVALYKTASTIPLALSFLPSTVVVYVLPYFVKNNKNLNWLKDKYNKMLKYGAVVYGFITIFFVLGADFLFKLLYTSEYNGSVLSFQILMIGFFFTATIKTPTVNVLYAMRKLKFNLIITLLSVISNLVFNILFIHLFGINGAAITTSLINIVSSLLLLCYMKRIV